MNRCSSSTSLELFRPEKCGATSHVFPGLVTNLELSVTENNVRVEGGTKEKGEIW